jgi:hypothetical protein
MKRSRPLSLSMRLGFALAALLLSLSGSATERGTPGEKTTPAQQNLIYACPTDPALYVGSETCKTTYRTSYLDVYNTKRAIVEQDAETVADIYLRNVFPETKVTWGVHPNDCAACHNLLAVQERTQDPR